MRKLLAAVASPLDTNAKLIDAYQKLVEAQKKENQALRVHITKLQKLVAAQIALIDLRNKQAEKYQELIEAITISQSLSDRPN